MGAPRPRRSPRWRRPRRGRRARGLSDGRGLPFPVGPVKHFAQGQSAPFPRPGTHHLFLEDFCRLERGALNWGEGCHQVKGRKGSPAIVYTNCEFCGEMNFVLPAILSRPRRPKPLRLSLGKDPPPANLFFFSNIPVRLLLKSTKLPPKRPRGEGWVRLAPRAPLSAAKGRKVFVMPWYFF